MTPALRPPPSSSRSARRLAAAGSGEVLRWTLAPLNGVALRFTGPARLVAPLRQRFATWPAAPDAAPATLDVRLAAGADPPDLRPLALPAIRLSGSRLRLEGPGLRGDADLRVGTARLLVGGPQAPALMEYAARVLTALLLDREGGLLLHGAGLVRDGRGLLLLGPSGTGKTTAARNAAGARVLNDDLVGLRPAGGGGWDLHATPFSNPSQVRPTWGQAPLAGILRLRQAWPPAMDPLSTGLALAELAAAVPVLAADAARLPDLMARLAQVAQATPCAVLRLGPRPDYWSVVDAWLARH